MQITAVRSKHAYSLILAVALCAVVVFSGCGRKETGAPSGRGQNSTTLPMPEPPEIPVDEQIEQKLDPLTKNDVEIYLQVMRAAAGRVKSPTPGDLAALDGARKILAASGTGRIPTHGDVMTLERANLVAISMDQIVAEEMKLDGRTYRGIAEAVEAVVPNPLIAMTSGDGGASAPNQFLTPIEKRLSAANAANEKFLAANRDEIQKLIAVVRNPENLPK
jgi:hypothetical protein